MRRPALLLAAVALVTSALLAACPQRAARPEPVPDGPPPPPPGERAGAPDAGPALRPVTLLVGGDVTLGQNLTTYLDQQADAGVPREELLGYGFARIAHVTRAADLFLVNLEAPFTERGQKLPKNFNFRARPELVESLVLGGVDVVSLANNHLMDYGAEGLLDTLMTLERARIPYFGAGRTLAEARRPAVVTVGGVRFAFLGYFFLGERNIEPPEAYATETTPGVAGHFSDVEVMERMLVEDVRAARAHADVVLPFFHWGREGQYVLEPYQVRLTRAAIAAGAAGVLGSHPHVLHAMELHEGAPGIYSLGNLVFGGNWNPRDRRTALLAARFTPGGYVGAEVLPMLSGDFPARPMQPYFAEGQEARDVLQLVAGVSTALPRMLPELEPHRPAPNPDGGPWEPTRGPAAPSLVASGLDGGVTGASDGGPTRDAGR